MLAALVVSWWPTDVRAAPTRENEHSEERTEPAKAEPTDGVARPARHRGRKALWIPRSLLYVPRRAILLALAPIRVAIWAYDRYDLRSRFYRVFYFEDRTWGLYPTARFQSQLGASVGGRMVHHDLFDNGGRLDVHGSWGRNFGGRATLEADTGWLGRSPIALGVDAEYRLIPADRFYGIGNVDVAGSPDDEPADALRRDRAIASRFSHEVARGGPVVAIRIAPPVRLAASTTYTSRRFGPPRRAGDDPRTDQAFTRNSLVGYGGVSNVYTQLRLTVDTHESRWTSAVPSSGTFASFYGGYAHGLGVDPSRFGRAGVDLQRYIDLFDGNRVLRLRLVVDTVIGSLRRIPFAELPSLGGAAWLRGYPRARFRDRVAAIATVEYVYPIDHRMSGFLFIEPGRVWSDPGAITPEHLRMGFGGGFQLHRTSRFIARIQLASTIEGGFHVNLVFSPPTAPRDST